MPVLTISRQPGSLGDEIAGVISSKLGWSLMTRKDILEKFLKPVAGHNEYNMLCQSSKFYKEKSSEGMTFLDHARKGLIEKSQNESLVIVGFGAQIIFGDMPDSVHLRVTAPFDLRAERTKNQFSVSFDEAVKIVTTADRKQKRYISNVFGEYLENTDLYDIVLNTGRINVDESVSMLMNLFEQKKAAMEMARTKEDPSVVVRQDGRIDFKHPAEQEFARILDMYQIDWRYEPKTFPIEWDAEGNVTLAFSPDFYLPKFDTYLELTKIGRAHV